MNRLAIDTSTSLASVALMIEGTIWQKEATHQRQHAQFLLPMIEDLLCEANVRLHELDGIIFGCGPGSFTGLRIACSIAKGLAYAADLCLFPVSSLETIAFAAGERFSKQPILSMLDARMQQVYWQYVSSDMSTSPAVSDAALIQLPSSEPVVLAGVGFQGYVEAFPQETQSKIHQVCEIFPSAQSMLQYAQINPVDPVSASVAVPMYVRHQVTQGVGCG